MESAASTSGGAVRIGEQAAGAISRERPPGGMQVIGGVQKSYTDASFARHLDKEGLTKAFVDLRLFCCFAPGRPCGTRGTPWRLTPLA